MTTDNLDLDGRNWLPVPGYNGLYEVSDHGEVRSLNAGRRKGAMLSQCPTSRGYLAVTLFLNGRSKTRTVHRLVAEAFLPRAGVMVRHLNDVKTDNRLSNLAWGTPRDDALDAIRNGRNPMSRATHCARGHDYTEGSFRMYRGWRRCEACLTINRRAQSQRDQEGRREAQLRKLEPATRDGGAE